MRKVKLEDLCSDIIDCPHTTPKWQTRGIPVIRNFNLHNRYINLDGSDISYVDEATYHQRIKRATPEPGDIVISREAPMGVVGLIPEGMKCCMGQRLVLLKVNRIKCNPVYLLHALTSEYVQTQIRRIDTRGSIVSNIDLDTLRELEIPIIDGQEEAADLLDSISRKIETNTKVIAELESLARTIYDYWFTQFDFPDEHGNPYRSSGGAMVHNEALHRDIPDEWSVAPANKLFSIDRGISYSGNDLSKEGTPMINLASFNTDGTYKAAGIKYFRGTVKETKYLHPNDLVMCVTQQTPIDQTGMTDVIAKTFLVPDVFNGEITMSMDVVRLSERCKGTRFLLNQMLARADYHRYASGYASGTKIKHLDAEGALSFPVALPHDSVLIDRYAALSQAWFGQISNRLQENFRLTSLRDRLLPLLMNGQATIDK